MPNFKSHTYNLIGASILLLTFVNATSQNSWSLEQCIDYALENNLQVKKASLSTKLSKANLLQSKLNALPNLNGFANNAYNFGQTIDPFTNDFARGRVQSTSFSLQSTVILFQGLRTLNTIKQNEWELKASNADFERAKNELTLSILSAYLTVLFNNEIITVNQEKLKLSQQQLQQTQKLVDAGALPNGNLLDSKSQMANAELALVNAQNQYNLSTLNLSQLLNLRTSEKLLVDSPQENNTPDNSIDSNLKDKIINEALNNQPAIKQAEYKLRSAEKSLAIAKGLMSPTLSLSGSYGTGFSGNNKEVVNTELNGIDTIGITNKGDLVLIPTFVFDQQVKAFNIQLKDNLNQSIGFSLSVPIFNRWNTQTSIAKAKIAIENAMYDQQIAENQLKNDIEKAFADAEAALKKFEASKNAINAIEESFKYTKERYEIGAVNTLDYNTALTNLSESRSSLLQAKYDYLFKLKILDFYAGKPITM